MSIFDDLDKHKMPTNRRRRFPGLRKYDAAILQLHIEHKDFQPDSWYFDVPIGPVDSAIAHAPWIQRYPAELRMYTNRIDILYLVHGVWTVCEIKPSASYVAVGQVLLYGRMFDNEYPTHAPCRRLIMTDWAFTPAVALCEELHIHLAQLPVHITVPYDPISVPSARAEFTPDQILPRPLS